MQSVLCGLEETRYFKLMPRLAELDARTFYTVYYRKAKLMAPNSSMGYRCYAAAYALLDRQDEAHAEAEEVMRLEPSFLWSDSTRSFPYVRNIGGSM